MIPPLQGQNSLKDKGSYILSYTHDIRQLRSLQIYFLILIEQYTEALSRN